jgi:2-polyprenyl-3-methyl-5-hydroxy-6-metoxy-1,4-benzoquinol methylase
VKCLVCDTQARTFISLDGRDYWRCDHCQATFLDPARRLAARDEQACYRLHENDPHDPAYRGFLARLATPLLERLAPGRHGLDFGCGPGPALAAMLREAGHAVELYDPFFYPAPDLLRQTYDFITCTEVVEHLHAPAETFRQLDTLLRPGGWLAIMTCFQTEDARFAGWQYRRDPTHVVFYREATLRHIADRHGWRCVIPVKDVALMHKPA